MCNHSSLRVSHEGVIVFFVSTVIKAKCESDTYFFIDRINRIPWFAEYI